jgi:hypothetical protein
MVAKALAPKPIARGRKTGAVAARIAVDEGGREGETRSLHPLEEYLRELRDLRRSGAATDEQSYYPGLRDLLNAVGAQLKPRSVHRQS